jgi:hypothetical protein
VAQADSAAVSRRLQGERRRRRATLRLRRLATPLCSTFGDFRGGELVIQGVSQCLA